MKDPFDLNWYRDEANRLRDIARTAFGVELNDRERKDIRDAIYHAVTNAKYRADAVGRSRG